jgi:hypothetical protein
MGGRKVCALPKRHDFAITDGHIELVTAIGIDNGGIADDEV